MSSYLEALDLNLPASTVEGQIRQQILGDADWAPTPTSIVGYTAANRVLLIADDATAAWAAERVQLPIELHPVTPGAFQLEGYLGRFTFQPGEAAQVFDQVIDCSDQPLMSAAIPPPGYHHVGDDRQALAAALDSAPDLVGEFEKPKYFDYDPSICAHGRSGIAGCTRCIDACPTEAIISIGETIEVNSHLCQGGGTCASRCPSGAITYRYPQAGDQIELVRRLIRDWRKSAQGEAGASLLLFDNELGAEQVGQHIQAFPENVLPIRVEEIGAAGLDLMAAAMAYGATVITLLVPPPTPSQVRQSLERDVALLESVSDQLKLTGYRIQLVDALDAANWQMEQTVSSPATFAAIGNKRNTIRTALKHLAVQSDATLQSLDLPADSIFGQVLLNEDACTLCMGCVSVCPASALEAGGEEPALKFVEANCVQCGICTRACPESAIEIAPRLHLDDDTVRRPRYLKKEEPFRCIKCSKPFATHAMIKRMTEKLSGHWMFETEEARNRLRMCEDCRVADML